MNIKPDDKLAVIVYANTKESIGIVVEVLGRWGGGSYNGEYFANDIPAWVVKSIGRPIIGADKTGRRVALFSRPVADCCLRPIRDQPGNEEFVTKLRDKLPRSKPATTKGDTITERELQS